MRRRLRYATVPASEPEPLEAPMSYRSLIAFVAQPSDLGTLDAAAALARDWNAHIDALCLGEIVMDMPDAVGFAGTAGVYLPVVEEIGAALEETKALAAARLEKSDLSWSCESILGETAMLTRGSTRAARFADLSILTGPVTDHPSREAVFAALLFDTGTPVLLLPDASPPQLGRVMVSWDGSLQALAATRAALPLLQAAERVEIVSVDPPRRQTDENDAGESLALMLSRHDVRCELTALPGTLPRIADTLERRARDTGAGLVVMGGYGHSRMREALLGGVTRDMVRRAELPLFLAH